MCKTWHSRSCPNSCSSCYNSCLVTWTVVRLTAAKLKPLIISVLGFAFSDVANMCISMILYGLWLLPAQFRYIIINTLYLESYVQLADRGALWKFTNGAENLTLVGSPHIASTRTAQKILLRVVPPLSRHVFVAQKRAYQSVASQRMRRY
jgi:hypothetical protein